MSAIEQHARPVLNKIPFVAHLRTYTRADLGGDLLAGTIVAIMLVPQAMAYAMLAGLPPQVGLYASISAPIIYGLLGSSRSLAVGPVALTSLLSASVIAGAAELGFANGIVAAAVLALLVGVVLFLMGALGLGLIVNFISRPVLSGFTSAAAILIAFSQIRHIFGLNIPNSESFLELVVTLGQNLGRSHVPTLILGFGGIFVMLFFGKVLSRFVANARLPWISSLAKAGPFVVAILSTVVVWAFGLDEHYGIRVVGEIPSGLPPVSIPGIDLSAIQNLALPAATLALIAFLESVSVAKALASRRSERLDANQELIALGAANIGASLTGGYPVAGGFSRSAVNFYTGAKSGVASIVSAILVGAVLLLLMPVLYYLPTAALAAIIMVSVVGLIDFKIWREVWTYGKGDLLPLLATFSAVLAAGVEAGILFGIALSLGIHLWRSTRPHVATVGRVGSSEHFRNVSRYSVETCPHAAAVRVDEGIYFANAPYLEGYLAGVIAKNPGIKNLVLICSAVNFIDVSGLKSLESIERDLANTGVTLHFAEIKGPVLDRLRRVGFLDRLGEHRLHMSTHQAMLSLGCN